MSTQAPGLPDPLMYSGHVLGLKLDSEQGSDWRKGVKERKGTSSVHRSGLRSFFLPSLIGASPPVATSLVIWVCLGSWVVGQGLLTMFDSFPLERGKL